MLFHGDLCKNLFIENEDVSLPLCYGFKKINCITEIDFVQL